MSKFLLNLLVEFLQVLPNLNLLKFKIKFFLNLLMESGLVGPASPRRPTSLIGHRLPRSVRRAQRALAYSSKRRLLFGFAYSGRDVIYISCHCHVGPSCLLSLPPSAPLSPAAPTLNPAAFSHVHCPARHLKMPPQCFNQPP
jgi:hypothetical protein